MASPRNQELLMKIVEGQAILAEKVETMNVRLFGGEGQQGALKFMYDKHDEHTKEISAVKDKISADIKKFNEDEVKPLVDKVTSLATESRVTMWRVGALTGFFGTAMGIGIELLIKKFFRGA